MCCRPKNRGARRAGGTPGEMGWNRREQRNDRLSAAEILAMRQGERAIGGRTAAGVDEVETGFRAECKAENGSSGRLTGRESGSRGRELSDELGGLRSYRGGGMRLLAGAAPTRDVYNTVGSDDVKI